MLYPLSYSPLAFILLFWRKGGTRTHDTAILNTKYHYFTALAIILNFNIIYKTRQNAKRDMLLKERRSYPDNNCMWTVNR